MSRRCFIFRLGPSVPEVGLPIIGETYPGETARRFKKDGSIVSSIIEALRLTEGVAVVSLAEVDPGLCNENGASLSVSSASLLIVPLFILSDLMRACLR